MDVGLLPFRDSAQAFWPIASVALEMRSAMRHIQGSVPIDE
jgi:hypothetical protein